MLKRDELTFSQPCEGMHRIMEETKSKVAAVNNPIIALAILW